MPKKKPDIVFRSEYHGVPYEVQVRVEAEGINLNILEYGSFANMVTSVTPNISHTEAQVVTRAEYGKCLLEAARHLGKLKSSRKE